MDVLGSPCGWEGGVAFLESPLPPNQAIRVTSPFETCMPGMLIVRDGVGFRVLGLGFRVDGLGFRFRVWLVVFPVLDLRVWSCGLGLRESTAQGL